MFNLKNETLRQKNKAVKLKIVLILIFFPTLGYSQMNDFKDGHLFIKEANNALEKNEIEKANMYVEKASQCNYGFCGNAWANAKASINMIKAQILNKENKFDDALKILDSINDCNLGVNCNKRDSLKIETLFLKYGKKKVVNSFKLVTEVERNEDEYDSSYSIYLKELNYTLSFGGNFTVAHVDENGKAIQQSPRDNEFVKIARQYEFYGLIEK